jgi:hypothetical protein
MSPLHAAPDPRCLVSEKLRPVAGCPPSHFRPDTNPSSRQLAFAALLPVGRPRRMLPMEILNYGPQHCVDMGLPAANVSEVGCLLKSVVPRWSVL